VVENVQVIVDKTTRIDFELREEIFEGEEVVVTAERGIVQVDRTTTTAVVDGEQLAALPVTSIGQAIDLQAGVVDGRFRGGRSGEVAYLVNGVPINNAFNNQAAFDVEQNMVASLEVISGVFNAEYGQALSGVVNIVTKDVADEWSASFLGYIGTLASSKSIEFTNRSVAPGNGLLPSDFSSEQVKFFDAAGLEHFKDIQFSAGGPVIKDRLGMQASLRYLDDKGYIFGRDLFSPSDSSAGLTQSRTDEWIIESTGDGEIVPMGAGERLSLNLTANVRISRTFNLDYNLFLQDGSQKPFDQYFKYVPEGVNNNYFFSQTHIVGLRYTVGNKSYGNVSYSYLKDDFESRRFDLPGGYDLDYCLGLTSEDLTTENLQRCKLDSRYQTPRLSSLVGSNAFSVGGNYLGTGDETTTTHTILADFSSQVNRIHLMKAGVQARLHSLSNLGYGIEKSARTQFTAQISPSRFSKTVLEVNPVEFSAYVQDKMEFEGLIVNAGIRFDLFDPDYVQPVDWAQAGFETVFNPCLDPDLDPAEREECYLAPYGVDAGRWQDAGSGADVRTDSLFSNRIRSDVQLQISPRIGIAFPISSTGVMRFSAGLFFQTPRLNLLYENPEYEVPPSSSVQFGNPGLDPERTLAFEVGLQQGVTEDIGLELTLFAKDVRNLTGLEIERTPRGNYANRYINTDYGSIRGLTFSLYRRPGSLLSWTLDYTLQFAEGTASDPGLAFEREIAGLEKILSLERLNWDRRHVLNGTATLVPYEGFSLTFVGRMRSGEPYTTTRNFVRSTQVNNADRPLQFFSDLRVYYKPKMIKQDLQLFLQIENLFDTRPEYVVYSSSGRADESLEKELDRARTIPVGGVNSLDEWYFNQGWFGGPRRVSLGLSVRI
jgi:outer membrane receptor protein involved in Fe transport